MSDQRMSEFPALLLCFLSMYSNLHFLSLFSLSFKYVTIVSSIFDVQPEKLKYKKLLEPAIPSFLYTVKNYK